MCAPISHLFFPAPCIECSVFPISPILDNVFPPPSPHHHQSPFIDASRSPNTSFFLHASGHVTAPSPAPLLYR